MSYVETLQMFVISLNIAMASLNIVLKIVSRQMAPLAKVILLIVFKALAKLIRINANCCGGQAARMPMIGAMILIHKDQEKVIAASIH